MGDGGASLTLDGNLWKRVALDGPVLIGEGTRLRLDMAVGERVPEVVAVGFDADDDPLAGPRTLYQLAGTQNVGRFPNVEGAPSGGGERYVIDLSAHAGTRIDSLVFAADDDRASDGLGSATFSDVALLGAGDPGPPPPGGAIGQAGVASVKQGSSGQWFSVTFAEALENPAVVMGPISFNGGQAATMRVREVSDTGFEFQLDEWDYLDGAHTAETVSWLAVESGVHVVGGQKIAAGVGQASEAGGSIGFGTSFGSGSGSAPVVAAQVTSTNDPDAATDRISGVTGTGFTVKLDDEEANGSAHGAESLAWIAMQKGGSAASGLLAGATGDRVRHEPVSEPFGGAFDGPFAFVADMQTEDGNDPATVRLVDLAASGATLFVEEERSRDEETVHTTEDVGLIALATGAILSDDPLG